MQEIGKEHSLLLTLQLALREENFGSYCMILGQVSYDPRSYECN